jgi:outer membrane protein assembly factor BamB
MKKALLVGFCALIAGGAIEASVGTAWLKTDWPQWGRTSLHNSSTSAIGQSPQHQLAHVAYDPFVKQEQAESGGVLLAHYQVPLVSGELAFLEFKTGNYTPCDPPGSGQPYPCGPDAWNKEVWNERAFVWQNGRLVRLWNFQSDWKPEPNSDSGALDGLGLFGWEPVFHAALGGRFVYVPGSGGTLYKLSKWDGSVVGRTNPFGNEVNLNRFVSGPLSVDPLGNVYYNVVELDPKEPWANDIRGAWLVKVEPDGLVHKVSYSNLAPPSCNGCGSQRPGINESPAVSIDGNTIYTATAAHFDGIDSYLLAVNADLTPRWQTSLELRNGIQGFISDFSSATPVVLPDGGVLYGVLTPTSDQGYALKFGPSGQYLREYNFGWDDTPAVYVHGDTYSIITKDNRYDTSGPYYITQLNADLEVEWQYQSPDDFEWCVNAPAVDGNGTVYADSEDGNVYAINQGGTLKGKLFLQSALGAAYTPVSIARDGKIYTENDGDIFVVGKIGQE